MADPRDELLEHVPSLRAFAVSLVRNRTLADDMVQDTLVKAWTNMDRFQEGTNMRAWLFTILRNTFYSYRRKAKREVEDSDGAMTESMATKPSHDGVLFMKDFMEAFHKLSLEHREVLVLIGVNGMSYEEVAEMCNIRIGTVKSRLNRARSQLAEMLDVNDEEAMELTDSVTAGIVSSRQPAA